MDETPRKSEHLKSASDRVSPSRPFLPPPSAPLIDPSRLGFLGKPGEKVEFLVLAHTRDGDREWPPFIVLAEDVETAGRMCRRPYLVIRSIDPYRERAGEPKPRVYTYGPPISDRTFEADYHNRPPDPDGDRGGSDGQAAEGGLWILWIFLRLLRIFGG